MGSYYRERHEGAIATTTSDDVSGLTGTQATEPSEDMTLAELQELAESKGLKTYGTKADLIERITDASS